ncbi:hypothetical protein Tco_0764819, partial [Tanacetum coccineum]
MPGCSWRGHLRGVHIHYCPGVLGGDTWEGYIFITVWVFLEETPVMGTYGFHYCPGVLGGDTYDGYIVHTGTKTGIGHSKCNISHFQKLSNLGTLDPFEPWPPPREEESSYTLSLNHFQSHGFFL